jgi:hypothetical protein
VLSSLAVFIPVAIVSVALGILVCLATVTNVAAIAGQQAELVAKGVNVFAVTGQNNDFLSSARCEELNAVPGVLSAGGVGTVQSFQTPTLGETQNDLRTLTRGAVAIIWPTHQSPSPSPSIIAGASLGTQLGLTAGSRVTLATNGASRLSKIDAVEPPSPRDEQYDHAAVEVVVPPYPIVTCLVEARPGSREAVESLLLGWFASSPKTNVSPYFLSTFVGPTPAEQLNTRYSQWVPLEAGGVLLIVLIATWWGRRSDFALYLLLGARGWRFALIVGAEFTVVGLVPAALGISIGTVAQLGQLHGLVLSMTILDALRFGILTLAIPAVGVALLQSQRSLDLLKGK